MKTLLLQVIRALVDHPQEATLTEVVGAQTVIYELHCRADDIGKIIGRNGRTINALRGLAEALAMRRRLRVVLEVVE